MLLHSNRLCITPMYRGVKYEHNRWETMIEVECVYDWGWRQGDAVVSQLRVGTELKMATCGCRVTDAVHTHSHTHTNLFIFIFTKWPSLWIDINAVALANEHLSAIKTQTCIGGHIRQKILKSIPIMDIKSGNVWHYFSITSHTLCKWLGLYNFSSVSWIKGPNVNDQ